MLSETISSHSLLRNWLKEISGSAHIGDVKLNLCDCYRVLCSYFSSFFFFPLKVVSIVVLMRKL